MAETLSPEPGSCGNAASHPAQLELDVERARGADAGAPRVELCAAPAEKDRITPSLGLVEQAWGVSLPMHVLVRAGPGDFVYTVDTVDELEVTERDVAPAPVAGNGPDAEATLRLSETAHRCNPTAEVTFHRAFDAALFDPTDAAEALERLRRSGVDRVLTSGGSPDCKANLRRLPSSWSWGRNRAVTPDHGWRRHHPTPDIVPALLKEFWRLKMAALVKAGGNTGG